MFVTILCVYLQSWREKLCSLLKTSHKLQLEYIRQANSLSIIVSISFQPPHMMGMGMPPPNGPANGAPPGGQYGPPHGMGGPPPNMMQQPPPTVVSVRISRVVKECVAHKFCYASRTAHLKDFVARCGGGCVACPLGIACCVSLSLM